MGMPSPWVLGIYHALSYGSMLSLGNWIPSLLAEVSFQQTATQLAWGGALVMLVSGLSRKDPGELQGRTENNRVVNFAAAEHGLIGTFVPVRITEALPNSLRGELAGS